MQIFYMQQITKLLLKLIKITIFFKNIELYFKTFFFEISIFGNCEN